MSRIAIVGAGIAGLHAAWRLAPRHDVTVFEAAAHAGGHTNTVDVEVAGRPFAIDTGFIVFNERTYPNFTSMLRELGVACQPSSMSFSLRCERTGLEYNGTSLDSLFAQRRNAVRPSFLRMIADILRFHRDAKRWLVEGGEDRPLGQFLREGRYSRGFVDRYVLPMGRAIWSAEASAILQFPARLFIDFFDRHGFLSIDDRPAWVTVKGGSREYVRALLGSCRARVRLSTPVESIRRHPDQVFLRTRAGIIEPFDHVFLACHADEALGLLERPTRTEAEVLGALPYAANEAILHTDASLLPRRPRARAAWNYHLLADEREPVALTYDMNVLQGLRDAPARFLVTLNRREAIDERRILRTFRYAHPVYTFAGVLAQQRHREVNGTARTYYCGAYWRCGFHEDGVVSAIDALAHFAEDEARAQLPLSRVG